MKPQRVSKGTTQSGLNGLFTKGMMAMHVRDIEVFNDPERLKAYAERMGFVLVQTSEETYD